MAYKKGDLQSRLRTTNYGIDYQSYYGVLNKSDYIDGSIVGTLAISVSITPEVGYHWVKDGFSDTKYYSQHELRTMSFGTPDYGWNGLGYIEGPVGSPSTSQGHLMQYIQIRSVNKDGFDITSLARASLNCTISVSGIPGNEIPSYIVVNSNFTASWVQN